MFKSLNRLSSTALLAFVIAASTMISAAHRAGPPAIAFGLADTSMYAQGCFPAGPLGCSGPVFLAADFSGGFAATAAGVDPDGFTLTNLSNVRFVAMLGEPIVIQGTGLYRRSKGPDALHRLTLNVLVNGEPVIFESGVTPVPDSGHTIDISVSIHNLQNQDTLMVIVADPVVRLRTQGSLGI